MQKSECSPQLKKCPESGSRASSVCPSIVLITALIGNSAAYLLGQLPYNENTQPALKAELKTGSPPFEAGNFQDVRNISALEKGESVINTLLSIKTINAEGIEQDIFFSIEHVGSEFTFIINGKRYKNTNTVPIINVATSSLVDGAFIHEEEGNKILRLTLKILGNADIRIADIEMIAADLASSDDPENSYNACVEINNKEHACSITFRRINMQRQIAGAQR